VKRFSPHSHYLIMRDVLIASLAVWRLTHLLWGEDGPWDCFPRLRKLLGSSIVGKVLDCFYCLSLWLAVPFAYWIASSWLDRAVVWLAISGAAILLDRLTSPRNTPQATAAWTESPAVPPAE